jgi:tetratricopeptide (TPR) repeat protein
MDARLEAVKQRIELLSVIDTDRQVFGASKHQYALAPVLTGDELGALERTLGTALPDDVRLFLRRVGASGAGPYYGLQSLRRESGDDIVLADQGCGMSSLLVVTGMNRGEVWMDLGDGSDRQREAPSFLAWYEGWIDRALIEWAERAAPRLALDGPTVPQELEGASFAIDVLGAIKNPSITEATALGYLHLREGRYADADAAFVRASKAPSSHSDVLSSERTARLHRDRANIAYVRDDAAAAIAESRAGLAIHSIWFSTADELREVLERALHASGDADEALRVLEERAAQAYFDFALHHRLATEHLARNDVKSAIAALERAANMPNIGGPTATAETRVRDAFGPIVVALRTGGRLREADALTQRADLLLNAN